MEKTEYFENNTEYENKNETRDIKNSENDCGFASALVEAVYIRGDSEENIETIETCPDIPRETLIISNTANFIKNLKSTNESGIKHLCNNTGNVTITPINILNGKFIYNNFIIFIKFPTFRLLFVTLSGVENNYGYALPQMKTQITVETLESYF